MSVNWVTKIESISSFLTALELLITFKVVTVAASMTPFQDKHAECICIMASKTQCQKLDWYILL